MSDYEAKARERAAVLLRHIGGRNEALANQLVSEHTETLAAALIHAADEKLEGVLGKVKDRVAALETLAAAYRVGSSIRTDCKAGILGLLEAKGWLLEALGRKE